jgi:DUF971 family protein
MGLLDKIKPHAPAARPVDVGIDKEGGVVVRWADGSSNRFPPAWLRARCPCAECVEEWTGKRTVGDAEVDPAVRARGLDPVGNYAVKLTWSDGHDSGLFTWDTLGRLRKEHAAASGIG